MEAMQAAAEERQKNQEAESRAVRSQLWGSDETVSDDEMRQTILGDIHNPAPIIMPQQQQSTVGPLLTGAAIGAMLLGVPAAGVAGYLLSKDNEPNVVVSPGFDDSTVSIGLGRIEDYMKDES